MNPKTLLPSKHPVVLQKYHIITDLCPMSFYDKFEKEDYYLSPEGFLVFTEKYHLKRGYCCQNNCKHCPWKKKIVNPNTDSSKETG